jgi:hypothetical protein
LMYTPVTIVYDYGRFGAEKRLSAAGNHGSWAVQPLAHSPYRLFASHFRYQFQ